MAIGLLGRGITISLPGLMETAVLILSAEGLVFLLIMFPIQIAVLAQDLALIFLMLVKLSLLHLHILIERNL